MQRFFDLLFSSLALLVLLPLIVPVALILRFTGEGEVFFRQDRVGRGGRIFGLLKFATMLKNAPNMGSGTITVKNDPRVLPFGRILRKTKINELPQLINILKGDMSVIGPRPQTRRCFEAFPARSKNAIVRVRPGLSGIGSVVFRAEEEIMDDASRADQLYDEVIMPYKGRLEEWYVENRGVGVYFGLIFLTIWVVLFHSIRPVWRIFSDLPMPPKEISQYMK